MSYTNLSDGDVLNEADYEGNLAHGYHGQAIYDADVGGDDAYVITIDPAPVAYLPGMMFNVKVTTGNTGACSLDVNSLGVKAIKKNVSDDPETGDIEAGQIMTVIYDGTNFQLLTRPNRASTTVHGVAAFSSDNFAATAGVITVKDDGIIAEEISGLTGSGAVDSDKVPEGSTNLYVTTDAVTTDSIKTLTGSASNSGTSLTVTMNDYSFFPAIVQSNTGSGGTLNGSNAVSGTIGEFVINSPASGTNSAAWRYVTASDKDHWIYIVVDNDEIIYVWESGDHCPTENKIPNIPLEPGQQIYIIDSNSELMNELEIEKKKQKKFFSQIILSDYTLDEEKEWKERFIIEHDEFDDKGGRKYIPKYDKLKQSVKIKLGEDYAEEKFEQILETAPTKLKYLTIDKLPDDVKYASIKKKG